MINFPCLLEKWFARFLSMRFIFTLGHISTLDFPRFFHEEKLRTHTHQRHQGAWYVGGLYTFAAPLHRGNAAAFDTARTKVMASQNAVRRAPLTCVLRGSALPLFASLRARQLPCQVRRFTKQIAFCETAKNILVVAASLVWEKLNSFRAQCCGLRSSATSQAPPLSSLAARILRFHSPAPQTRYMAAIKSFAAIYLLNVCAAFFSLFSLVPLAGICRLHVGLSASQPCAALPLPPF
jgi:hypothetical protein